MAGRTGCGGIVDRMAIGAGCMFMVGTTEGVVEGGIPITCGVALCAV